MSKSKLGRPKANITRDLRNDLLKTSRDLLNEGGPAAISMREVARRSDCTHQAPYHYFEDRESILATLVAEGFAELARRLAEANELATTDGVRSALVASGATYVEFALSQPGVFRIMFRPDVCNPSRFPSVQEAGARARDELQRLNVIAYGKKASPALATILWSHVHGLSCLLVDGPLGMNFETASQKELHLLDVGKTFADLVLQPMGGSSSKL